LDFVASVVEVAAIAVASSVSRASFWIYAVTPIAPAYKLQTFHGCSLQEYFEEFGLY